MSCVLKQNLAIYLQILKAAFEGKEGGECGTGLAEKHHFERGAEFMKVLTLIVTGLQLKHYEKLRVVLDNLWTGFLLDS